MIGNSIYLKLKTDDWVYLLDEPSCRPGWYLVAQVKKVDGTRLQVKCLENDRPLRWVSIYDVGSFDA